MASGQIKKGFFFYFGMFVLLLVTVFLICLVIMIFNPGKTILWMKYFTGNETYQVTTATSPSTGDAKTAIPWNEVTNITINAPNYAKVTIQYTQTKNVAGSKKSDSGIYIKNHAKGFQPASNAVNFGWTATYLNGKLTLTLSEPNGFLFFSKDLEVVVHSNAYPGETINFNNKDFVINAGSGNVTIGKYLSAVDQKVTLKSLYAGTTSGNITLDRNFDTTSEGALVEQNKAEGKGDSHLFVQTGSGNIYASQNVEGGTGLQLNTSATFKTDKGHIRLGRVIASSQKVNIECKTGTVVIPYIKAQTVSIICTQGNYNINEVEGDLSFGGSADTIISPNITVQKVSGQFTVGSIQAKASPDINIGEVGSVQALCERGTLTINRVHGNVDVKATKMTLSINLDKDNQSQVTIENGDASTKVGIEGKQGIRTIGTITIISKGNVTISFDSSAQFTAVTYNYDEVKSGHKGKQFTEDNELSRIKMSGFDTWESSKSKCPFKANGYSGTENVTVILGGKANVTFNLVKSASN